MTQESNFSAISDHILFYRKSEQQLFHQQYTPHADKTLKEWYLYLELSDGSIRRMTKQERESQEIPAGSRRFNMADMTSPNPRPNLMYKYKGYPYPPKGWRYSIDRMEELDRQGKLLYPMSSDGRIMLKRYLDEQQGVTVGDIWVDIDQLRASMSERLGYPTQKPLALLERIILASSNPGDIVLDPFCGCGTAVAAAQKLNRRWIGIDITHLSIALQKYRLQEMFPGIHFKIIGEPVSLESAKQLAREDRYQFQWWALSLIKAKPVGGDGRQGKKGADKGIDGIINFVDSPDGKLKRVIVQVKSGKVKLADIHELNGVITNEKAEMAVFITLEEPTRPMITDAVTAGMYHSPGWNKDFPKIQILTIEELLKGAEIKMPPPWGTFRIAEKVTIKENKQKKLDI